MVVLKSTMRPCSSTKTREVALIPPSDILTSNEELNLAEGSAGPHAPGSGGGCRRQGSAPGGSLDRRVGGSRW
jgi:hypothetical protein